MDPFHISKVLRSGSHHTLLGNLLYRWKGCVPNSKRKNFPWLYKEGKKYVWSNREQSGKQRVYQPHFLLGLLSFYLTFNEHPKV